MALQVTEGEGLSFIRLYRPDKPKEFHFTVLGIFFLEHLSGLFLKFTNIKTSRRNKCPLVKVSVGVRQKSHISTAIIFRRGFVLSEHQEILTQQHSATS